MTFIFISGGQGYNIPSLTSSGYYSITQLPIERLSARHCNISRIDREFIQAFRKTLKKIDLSCNLIQPGFTNITTGLSNSKIHTLLLDNIYRIVGPG